MLRVKNLNTGYGKLQILHDLSLEVEKGAFTAILGPNGSGKSTLLKSIFGLTTHYSGTVQLNDIYLHELDTAQISTKGIAYVPQRQNIYTSMTVLDNLLLALRNTPKSDKTRLLDTVYELLPILIKRQQQIAGQLSGGERQMLAIAIAWLAQPAMMLLDEPSAGLSPLITQEVFNSLETLRQSGVTIVVVEQNARTAIQYCSNVIILREGTVAFLGSREESLADEEKIVSYLGAGIQQFATT